MGKQRWHWMNSLSVNKFRAYKQMIVCLAIFLIDIYSDELKAEGSSPQQIEVENLNWISPPPIPGLELTWVTGTEKNQGLYVLRVKLAPNTRIPPHTHPDQRLSTVLEGTLYVGFGENFDETKLLAVQQGNAYIAPAQTPHFIWAKDGEVIYQETGVGPTATEILSQ